MRNNYVDPSYHIERSVNKQGNQKEIERDWRKERRASRRRRNNGKRRLVYWVRFMKDESKS